MATPLAALIPDAHATIHQLDAPPEEPPAPEPRDCDPVACTLPINQTERNVARRRFCSCDVGRAARRAAEVRLYGVDADLAPDVPVRLYGATLELAAELAAAEPLRAGAIAAAAAFVDRYREGSIPGAGLAIFGPVGTGKSGLVAGILRDARALGVPSLWYTYLDLLDAVRNQYGRREDGQRLNAACAVPLLAIDDLGDPYRIRGDVQETENRRHIINIQTTRSNIGSD